MKLMKINNDEINLNYNIHCCWKDFSFTFFRSLSPSSLKIWIKWAMKTVHREHSLLYVFRDITLSIFCHFILMKWNEIHRSAFTWPLAVLMYCDDLIHFSFSLSFLAKWFVTFFATGCVTIYGFSLKRWSHIVEKNARLLNATNALIQTKKFIISKNWQFFMTLNKM